jgi:glycosyltransferase involved in cell wall biosynthesis
MKISLITPTYNSGKTIADTIESIITQNYIDLEYIVIDGNSTDETKEIISSYQNKVNIKLISEPDKGIYDAMNKGVRMATGDIIGILNSDDFYYDDTVLSKVNNIFELNADIDAVYGDLVYVNKDNTAKQTRYWKAGQYEEEKLDYGWIIPHPTFFVKRDVYEKCEKIFDTSFLLAADYELLLRLLKITKIKVRYIPETLVSMREGGASANNLKQRIRGWQELRKAWKVNNLKIPRFFILRRLLSKVGQYLNNR